MRAVCRQVWKQQEVLISPTAHEVPEDSFQEHVEAHRQEEHCFVVLVGLAADAELQRMQDQSPKAAAAAGRDKVPLPDPEDF